MLKLTLFAEASDSSLPALPRKSGKDSPLTRQGFPNKPPRTGEGSARCFRPRRTCADSPASEACPLSFAAPPPLPHCAGAVTTSSSATCAAMADSSGVCAGCSFGSFIWGKVRVEPCARWRYSQWHCSRTWPLAGKKTSGVGKTDRKRRLLGALFRDTKEEPPRGAQTDLTGLEEGGEEHSARKH